MTDVLEIPSPEAVEPAPLKLTPLGAVTKVTCKSCEGFCGFIQKDGSGPYLGGCHKGGFDCQAVAALEKFAPKRRPLGIGGGHGGPPDDDIGSYRTNAVRALEDQD